MSVKSFILLGPEPNVIKTFLSVIYKFSQQSIVLVPVKPFQPSLTNALARYKICKSRTKKFYNIGPTLKNCNVLHC